jgi:hypothetical protein
MPRFKLAERAEAIRRGLDFIYHIALDPEHFGEYGSDLLYCFYFFAAMPADAALRRAAKKMGRERARQWRRNYPEVPARAEAGDIFYFIHGSDAADRLGIRDRRFKQQLKQAAARFSAHDFLSFDPASEPPPQDVPAACRCGFYNQRGRRTCAVCRRRLSMLSRYKVWYDALTTTYTGERYGVEVGARFVDCLKWLSVMRPYRGREADANPDFYDTVYAVTHVVYTLNDYDALRLSPRLLPDEFAFLKTHAGEAIRMEDAEMLGEFIDSLMVFGLDDDQPLIRRGMNYLLSQQNEDGSWGATDAGIYTRYHSTWTAMGGLLVYAWHGGDRLSFPELAPMLEQFARHQYHQR